MMRMQGTLTLTRLLKRHPRTTLQIIPLKKNLDHHIQHDIQLGSEEHL
jgi:hypothetical protein